MKPIAAFILVLVCLAAHAEESAQEKAKAHLKALNAAVASSDDACRFFTKAEMSKAIGKPVKAGEKWGLGNTGCEWEINDEDAVQVVLVRDVRYWENLDRAEGGEKLTGIAKEAFVAPWLGSFRAGALTDRGSVYVMTPKRALSVSLLKQAIERVPAK